MEKLLLILLLLFSTLNNTFAEQFKKEDVFASYIYKDNILNFFWLREPEVKYFNWKKLDDNFVKILVDENWKILHTVTWKILDKKTNELEYYLDWKLIDITNEDQISFLENGSILINKNNQPEWNKNLITLDWNIIFEWNKEEYDEYIYYHFLKTRIEKSSVQNSYFKDDLWELIKIVYPINWVATINKNRNYLEYDVVCKDNNIVFYYEWNELIGAIKARTWHFPEERKWIATYLNINWKSYLLKDDDVWEYKGKCIISFNNEKIKVENSEIVKVGNDEKKVLWKEFISRPEMYKLINKKWDYIFLQLLDNRAKKYIVNYNWIEYKIFSDSRTHPFLSNNWDVIFVYLKDNSIFININWEDKEKLEKGNYIDYDDLLELEDWTTYIKYNSEKIEIEELANQYTEIVDIETYLKLQRLNWGNEKEDNIKTVKIEDSNIYSKLDSKLEILYNKVSKKDLKYQMDTYKKLRIKITKLQKKYILSPKKELIDYLYEKINSKYKKVFRQYVINKN